MVEVKITPRAAAPRVRVRVWVLAGIDDVNGPWPTSGSSLAARPSGCGRVADLRLSGVCYLTMRFTYDALNLEGRTTHGTLEAESRVAAIRALTAAGIYPTDLREVHAASAPIVFRPLSAEVLLARRSARPWSRDSSPWILAASAITLCLAVMSAGARREGRDGSTSSVRSESWEHERSPASSLADDSTDLRTHAINLTMLSKRTSSVSSSDPMVAQFERLLDSITRKCGESPSRIAAIGWKANQMLDERGVHESLSQTMRNLDEAMPQEMASSRLDVGFAEIAAGYTSLRAPRSR